MKKERNGFFYYKYSELSLLEKELYYTHIYYFLRHLVFEYPFFIEWYKNLFMSNFCLKSEREILICEKDFSIAGIAILKNNYKEQKICTLRINPRYRKCGIGKVMIAKSLDWLETDKPLITVHKHKSKEFSSLFKYYDFKLEQKNWSYYNLFSTELVYNGCLPGYNIILNKLQAGNIHLSDKLLKSKNNIFTLLEQNIDFIIAHDINKQQYY